MKWNKKGLIYVPDGSLWWAKKYAFPPIPLLIKPDVLRIYLTSCDENMVGRVGYVDVSPDDPKRILNLAKEPIFGPGAPGAFDENGVLPTTVIPVGDELWMYYVGYQLGQKVRYYQFQGLAVSKDGGATFLRKQRVPVLDRSDSELLNRCSAHVQFDGSSFRAWYSGGSDWTRSNGKDFPVYNVKYLESPNGVHWGDAGTTAVDLHGDEHALGKPFVVHAAGKYRMLYSRRMVGVNGYRLGYAESEDCLRWARKDEEIDLGLSSEGWDSESISYTSLWEHKDQWYMFYNGNNLGETGFGYAILESW
jgi:hypothetical protein